MIYKEVSFTDFCDSFSDTYKNNFTYEGKRALYDYLDDSYSSSEVGFELDIVALCCEYSEYDSAMDWASNTGDSEDFDREEDAIDYLRDKTTVIEFDGGIIIADF